MRIGINASFLRKPFTGTGQVSRNILGGLNEASLGHTVFKHTGLDISECEFFVYAEEDFPMKLPSNFYKRIFLPFWKRDDLIRKALWEKYYLPAKIKTDRCDMLISLYQSATITEKSIRHIMIVHDIIPKLMPEYLNNWRKKIYQKLVEKGIASANKIIAISRKTEKDLVHSLSIPPERISVSYIDVSEEYKRLPLNKTVRRVMEKYKILPGYILITGGLEKRKNIEGSLKAYKWLLEQNRKKPFVQDFPKLVVAGRLLPHLAPLVTDVEKMIRKMDLGLHAKAIGLVEQEDMPSMYRGASMLLFPSFYEGFGLPILEAMYQQIPVITSKKTSIPEVGRDAVLYCNPEDPQDIALVIKNLISNNRLRETIIQREKDQIKRFSWEAFIMRLFAIIKNEFEKRQ